THLSSEFALAFASSFASKITKQSVYKSRGTSTFDGHEYALVQTWGVKWIEAEAEARAMGGYLAAIDSQEENDFVVSLFRDEESVWRLRDEGERWQKFGPWIGLVQKNQDQEPAGGWVWSNGQEMTYSNWFWHQPDNYDGVEHFGRYRQFSDQLGIRWDDARQDTTAKGYVVEFE
ncbi:lectin-like protein, partial [Shimia aestuarii]